MNHFEPICRLESRFGTNPFYRNISVNCVGLTPMSLLFMHVLHEPFNFPSLRDYRGLYPVRDQECIDIILNSGVVID